MTDDGRGTDRPGAGDGPEEGDGTGEADGPDGPDGPDGVDLTDAHADSDDLDAVVAAVHGRLAATAELPVDPAASTRLGEAAAVARDLHRDPPAAPAVTRARLALVADLLAEVDGTGSRDADEHVAAARGLLSRALDTDSADSADPDDPDDS